MTISFDQEAARAAELFDLQLLACLAGAFVLTWAVTTLILFFINLKK